MAVLLVLLATWLGLNVALFTAAFALDRRAATQGAGGRAGAAPSVRALRVR